MDEQEKMILTLVKAIKEFKKTSTETHAALITEAQKSTKIYEAILKEEENHTMLLKILVKHRGKLQVNV